MQEIIMAPSRGMGNNGRAYIEITALDGRQHVILLGKDGLRWAPVRSLEELTALIQARRAATGDELQMNAARGTVRILECGIRRQDIAAGFITRFSVLAAGREFEISSLLAKRAQVFRVIERAGNPGNRFGMPNEQIFVGADLRWSARGLTLYRDKVAVLSTLSPRDEERDWQYHRDPREEILLERYEEALEASRLTFKKSGLSEASYQILHEESVERLEALIAELEGIGVHVSS